MGEFYQGFFLGWFSAERLACPLALSEELAPPKKVERPEEKVVKDPVTSPS